MSTQERGKRRQPERDAKTQAARGQMGTRTLRKGMLGATPTSHYLAMSVPPPLPFIIPQTHSEPTNQQSSRKRRAIYAIAATPGASEQDMDARRLHRNRVYRHRILPGPD